MPQRQGRLCLNGERADGMFVEARACVCCWHIQPNFVEPGRPASILAVLVVVVTSVPRPTDLAPTIPALCLLNRSCPDQMAALIGQRWLRLTTVFGPMTDGQSFI